MKTKLSGFIVRVPMMLQNVYSSGGKIAQQAASALSSRKKMRKRQYWGLGILACVSLLVVVSYFHRELSPLLEWLTTFLLLTILVPGISSAYCIGQLLFFLIPNLSGKGLISLGLSILCFNIIAFIGLIVFSLLRLGTASKRVLASTTKKATQLGVATQIRVKEMIEAPVLLESESLKDANEAETQVYSTIGSPAPQVSTSEEVGNRSWNLPKPSPSKREKVKTRSLLSRIRPKFAHSLINKRNRNSSSLGVSKKGLATLAAVATMAVVGVDKFDDGDIDLLSGYSTVSVVAVQGTPPPALSFELLLEWTTSEANTDEAEVYFEAVNKTFTMRADYINKSKSQPLSTATSGYSCYRLKRRVLEGTGANIFRVFSMTTAGSGDSGGVFYDHGKTFLITENALDDQTESIIIYSELSEGEMWRKVIVDIPRGEDVVLELNREQQDTDDYGEIILTEPMLRDANLIIRSSNGPLYEGSLRDSYFRSKDGSKYEFRDGILYEFRDGMLFDIAFEGHVPAFVEIEDPCLFQ